MWLEEEGSRCDRCGTYTWQWQYEDADGDWHNHPRDQIDREADYWTCVGCKEQDDLRLAATDNGKEPLPPGLQVRWFGRELIED